MFGRNLKRLLLAQCELRAYELVSVERSDILNSRVFLDGVRRFFWKLVGFFYLENSSMGQETI